MATSAKSDLTPILRTIVKRSEMTSAFVQGRHSCRPSNFEPLIVKKRITVTPKGQMTLNVF